jgi:hypothetical protein
MYGCEFRLKNKKKKYIWLFRTDQTGMMNKRMGKSVAGTLTSAVFRRKSGINACFHYHWLV